MESIILVPGLLMAVCVVGALVALLKARAEAKGVPSLVRFFGLEMLSSRYFTDKGRIHRRRFWQLFLSAFLFAIFAVMASYLSNAEFRQWLGS